MSKKIIFLLLFFCSFAYPQSAEIENLTLKLAYQEDNIDKARTSIELISHLLDANELDLATKHLIALNKISIPKNEHDLKAQVNFLNGKIAFEKDDYQSAINYFLRSERRAEYVNNQKHKASVNLELATIAIETGYFNEARININDAITHYEEHRNLDKLKQAYLILAEINLEQNDLDLANENYVRSEIILSKAKKTNISHVRFLEKLSAAYVANKYFNYAEDILQKALSNTLKTNINKYHILLIKLGKVQALNNTLDIAEETLIESYTLSVNQKNDYLKAISLSALGELRIKEKRYVLSSKQLKASTRILEQLDKTDVLLINYSLLKKVESLRGNYKTAIGWSNKWDSLHTKISNVKNTNQSPKIPLAFKRTSIPSSRLDQISKASASPITRFISFLNSNSPVIMLLLSIMCCSLLGYLIFKHKSAPRDLEKVNTLEREVLDLKTKNKTINEQTKHLKDANKVKDKIFSIVSHDLKDSLTSIKGFIDILNEGSLSQTEFKELLPELSENANNASLLMFNLLNWSKTQMESLDPNPTIFNIQDIVADKFKLLQKKATNKGVTLINKTKKNYIFADKSMVEIISQNLLANAIKFTSNGDSITVSNFERDGHVVFSVRDTGVGISKKNQAKLFNKETFTTSGTKNEKGTGLGLSISKELVELNKGKIWVESEKGIGTTFFVELPKIDKAIAQISA